MGRLFTQRDGTIRLYDGHSNPYYLKMEFENGDLDGPLGTPLTEEILVLHRGKTDANMHYIEGDHFALMAPVDITFTARLLDATADHSRYLLDWIDAMNDGATTTVNSVTLTDTQGTTQRDGANNNPTFADSDKLTCNVEFQLDGTNDVVFHFNEVQLLRNEQRITEGADAVTIAITGHVFGTITRDAAFSSGQDIT